MCEYCKNDSMMNNEPLLSLMKSIKNLVLLD